LAEAPLAEIPTDPAKEAKDPKQSVADARAGADANSGGGTDAKVTAKLDNKTKTDAELKAEAEIKAKTAVDMKAAKPAWIALLVVMGFATILVTLFGAKPKSVPLVWVELLLAATALSAGAFLGFLFGMPRPLADDGGQSTYRPSTNLEQVSDWLTKILIGAGLVQLANLRDGLAGIGDLVSRMETPVSHGAGLVAQLVVVAFLLIGFLSSFLWTRLYYTRILTETDRSLAGEVKQLIRDREEDKLAREELKQEVIRTQGETALSVKALAQQGSAGGVLPSSVAPGAGMVAGTDAQIRLPAAIQQKIEQFMKAPRVWHSDPSAELFPNAPREKDGRRLDAEIASNLGDGLLINVRVVRVTGDPLTADTLFLLHPTIPKRIHRVIPRGDIAETSFYSQGTFTVIAIADDGRTILGYDLTQLPGAPKWFREN
jgi:hypothetical protein